MCNILQFLQTNILFRAIEPVRVQMKRMWRESKAKKMNRGLSLSSAQRKFKEKTQTYMNPLPYLETHIRTFLLRPTYAPLPFSRQLYHWSPWVVKSERWLDLNSLCCASHASYACIMHIIDNRLLLTILSVYVSEMKRSASTKKCRASPKLS